jgi:hypothetical protein
MAYDGGPGAPPEPYGRSDPSYQPAPRRRRLWMWLGIGGGSVFVALIVLIGFLAATKTASSSPPASKPSAHASASSALGPLACVTAVAPAGGSGPWKLVTPRALCGLPQQNSAQAQQTGQALASEDNTLIGLNNAGSVTSTITMDYQSPQGIPNFYRSVTFVGFEGRFQPAAAASAIQESGYTYHSMPPGPHGGAMACADIYGSEDCVWATSTTACEFQIMDTTRELLGANFAANAVRIRDALEVPG